MKNHQCEIDKKIRDIFAQYFIWTDTCVYDGECLKPRARCSDLVIEERLYCEDSDTMDYLVKIVWHGMSDRFYLVQIYKKDHDVFKVEPLKL